MLNYRIRDDTRLFNFQISKVVIQMSKVQLIKEILTLRKDMKESTLVMFSEPTLKNILTVEVGQVEMQAREMANEMMA